jgi:hypothetical protein
MNVGSRRKPYPFRSRCTVVESPLCHDHTLHPVVTSQMSLSMASSLLMAPFQPHAKSVIGILGTWAANMNMPGASHYTGFGPIFLLVYYSITVFLDATLTFMICYCRG